MGVVHCSSWFENRGAGARGAARAVAWSALLLFALMFHVAPASAQQTVSPKAASAGRIYFRDGFYVRLAAGMGWMKLKSHLTEEFQSSTLALGGRAGASIGAGLAMGVEAAYQRAWLDNTGPGCDRAGVVEDCTNHPVFLQGGPFLSWYPRPSAGAHVDVRAGVAWATGRDDFPNKFIQQSGVTVGGAAGYDAWVGRQTTAGLSLGVDWMPSGEDSMSVVALTILANVSCH